VKLFWTLTDNVNVDTGPGSCIVVVGVSDRAEFHVRFILESNPEISKLPRGRAGEFRVLTDALETPGSICPKCNRSAFDKNCIVTDILGGHGVHNPILGDRLNITRRTQSVKSISVEVTYINIVIMGRNL